jgi:hypothetical protein
MKKETIEFKPGDWVILKESFIKKMNGEGGITSINKNSYPQKLKNIYPSGGGLSPLTLVFAPNKKWSLIENEFRLATEKEIKEQKIKNIFIGKK